MNKILTKYSNISDELRKECERKLKALLKNAKKGITFKESVPLHFVSDNIYTDLKRVDKDMLLYADVHIDSGGTADVFTYGIEELDASALYELLLAIEEKSFKVV
jgi:hypothetical protein